jgi:hypothetical protein
MAALREDPSSSYTVEADLPTGNMLIATVGPMIGIRCCASVSFRDQPPSERDKELALEILTKVMGSDPAGVEEVHGADAAATATRKFLGGGMG